MAKMKELKEQEEKAQWDAAEAVHIRQAEEEVEVARAAKSPPRDANNEELDYIDDLNQDTEMVSSQDTAPASSQESQEMAASQRTVPASSQEMTCASQESMSQDKVSMPSQDSTTNTTILNTASGVLMEEEACLEGPTLKCTLEEEWALLNPLFTGSLDQLEDVLLGYLNVLAAQINHIRKVKVSQMPMPSPRAPPGLPHLSMGQSASIQTSVSGATVPLSEAIYSATSNSGTTVPQPNQRTPTHPPDCHLLLL